jgi:hypothetical protein
MKNHNYQDIEIQVGTEEGYPIMQTVTAEDQKEWVNRGYGSIKELIDYEISTYRHWQSDC